MLTASPTSGLLDASSDLTVIPGDRTHDCLSSSASLDGLKANELRSASRTDMPPCSKGTAHPQPDATFSDRFELIQAGVMRWNGGLAKCRERGLTPTPAFDGQRRHDR
jgi:hypothetical protein